MELPIPMFYDEQEEWGRALLLYDSVLKEINTKFEILNNEFKLTHQYNPIEHITSRIKSPQSIAKKIRHQKRELKVENIVKYINDVAGIRIICSFTSDIYRIADLLTKQSDVKVLKIKDYIMNPKQNGYMSYHMIVTVPIYLSGEMIETKAEIQIRTIAMDFWASLEHKMYYKFEGNAPEYFRKELKECADIVAYLDQRMLSINEKIKNYSKEDEIDTVKAPFTEELKEFYRTVNEDEVEVEVNEKEIETSVVMLPYQQDQDMLSTLQERVIREKMENFQKGQSKATTIVELVPSKKSKSEGDKVPFTGSVFPRDRKKIEAAT